MPSRLHHRILVVITRWHGRITIVLDFSWDNCITREKLETMVMQFFFFGGGGEVQYGLYESSEYQISHRFLSWTLRLVCKNPFRVRGW